MRVQTELRLPPSTDPATKRQLEGEWRSLATQLNQLSEGQIVASTNAATGAPTGVTISYVQGDFIRNRAPSVLGAPGSQYVVLGWVCTASGAPGTWVECRNSTGT